MSAGAADRFKAGKYKHWGMDYLGTKANLPDLLACYLPDQIRTVDKRLVEREKLARKYELVLEKTKIKFLVSRSGIVHSRHLFPIHVGASNRDNALFALGEANIGATVNYRSVPTMGYYTNKYGFTGLEHPISKSWGDGTLSIPLFPGMREEEQDYVIDVLINKIDKMIGENQ
jgi:UDP-4-amino-4-deoxy-L-arabinose-oxoglutarate aminotransferase